MKCAYIATKPGAGRGQGGGRGIVEPPLSTPTPTTTLTPTPTPDPTPTPEPGVTDHHGPSYVAGKIELKPNEYWFNKLKVASGVSSSFKAHYNYPYMNWSEVTKPIRERWFVEFKRHFTWKPEYEDMVRKDYEKKCKERLKDHANKAAKVPPHEQIEWMLDEVHAAFIRKRKEPDFVQRSQKASTNRLFDQGKANFDPGHRQGSISTMEVAERMAAENNGKFPSAAAVYERIHSVELDDCNLVLGDKANQTLAEFSQKSDDYKKKGIRKEPDEVFLEVVGGRKKGKIYSLGSASSLFYKPNDSCANNDCSYVPSMISQLSSQLEECKNMAKESLELAKATQEKYEREKAEWAKEKEEFRKGMLDMQKTVFELSQVVKEVTSSLPLTFTCEIEKPSGGESPCANCLYIFCFNG